MQGMHPVPSSMKNRRNFPGFRSRSVTVPTVSARERGMPLRWKNDGCSDEEEEGVRERRSNARSLTWVVLL